MVSVTDIPFNRLREPLIPAATDQYTVIIKGDLDGDGVCDVLDAVLAERMANGHGTASKEQVYAANGCVSDELNVMSYQNVVNRALRA